MNKTFIAITLLALAITASCFETSVEDLFRLMKKLDRQVAAPTFEPIHHKITADEFNAFLVGLQVDPTKVNLVGCLSKTNEFVSEMEKTHVALKNGINYNSIKMLAYTLGIWPEVANTCYTSDAAAVEDFIKYFGQFKSVAAFVSGFNAHLIGDVVPVYTLYSNYQAAVKKQDSVAAATALGKLVYELLDFKPTQSLFTVEALQAKRPLEEVQALLTNFLTAAHLLGDASKMNQCFNEILECQAVMKSGIDQIKAGQEVQGTLTYFDSFTYFYPIVVSCHDFGAAVATQAEENKAKFTVTTMLKSIVKNPLGIWKDLVELRSDFKNNKVDDTFTTLGELFYDLFLSGQQ